MEFLRRARKSPKFTDYRKVSESVHELRAQRVRNPEVLREDPETTRATVRAYRPEERLRAVDQETRQLVEDCSDIPRNWDAEILPPPKNIRPLYLVLLALHLFTVIAAAGYLFYMRPEEADGFLLGTLLTGSFLIGGAFCYRSQLGVWARVGPFLGVIDAFFAAVYLTYR